MIDVVFRESDFPVGTPSVSSEACSSSSPAMS
jgi:hypothetical protein